jgi:hypothetical protein
VLIQTAKAMAVDNLASTLGSPGKFQMILYIMLCCNTFFVAWNHLGMAFMGAKTKHHCRVGNTTDINEVVPLVKKGGKKEWDGCNLFVNVSTKEKQSCQNGWTYYLKGREQTIISEVTINSNNFIYTDRAANKYLT